ncbi:MAG: segregation/condensation protein A, partial [Leptonema sp. (in: Bacteria)]|nr:segregation/condensation protein A [Leptonema sp. (in: bacteria)]
GEEEGPLYVLWQLIESYRIDIFDISIHRITEDFLKFIERASALQMDLVSSFALMASRLVYYKSRALLPDPGFEEAENESRLPPELIEQLLEYRRFQLAADTFREMEDLTSFMLSRPQTEIRSFDPVEVYDIVDLVESYVKLLRRIEKQEEPEPFLEIINQELNVEERISQIRHFIETVDGFDFVDLFQNLPLSRMLIVVTVLAILELARLREIIIIQTETFAKIQIFRRTAIVL